MKGVIHKVYCDVYRHEFLITFCGMAYERRANNEIGKSNGITTQLPCDRVLIFIDAENGLPYTTLAHEVFHAVDFMMISKGADFVIDGSNEHWAYMIGWLLGKVLDCWDDEYRYKNRLINSGKGEQ